MSDRLRRTRDDLGYLALRSLFACARALPPGLVRVIGGAVGLAALACSRKDRRRAAEHLALAFPESSPRWRSAMRRAAARHLGQLLGEVAWLWSVSPQQLLARTELSGLDRLRPIAGTPGAVLITAHCGNWEWMNLALGASGIPMTVAARELFDPRLERVTEHLRGRFGGQTVVRGPEAGGRLLRALRRGRVAGFLIDQDIDAPGVFVEFFGQPAWTPVGPALLALKARSPVLTGFACRRPGHRMSVHIDEPLTAPEGLALEDRAAWFTSHLTTRIEAQIRAHPDQWVWMHRRWRRSPQPGDPVWKAAEAEIVRTA